MVGRAKRSQARRMVWPVIVHLTLLRGAAAGGTPVTERTRTWHQPRVPQLRILRLGPSRGSEHPHPRPNDEGGSEQGTRELELHFNLLIRERSCGQKDPAPHPRGHCHVGVQHRTLSWWLSHRYTRLNIRTHRTRHECPTFLLKPGHSCSFLIPTPPSAQPCQTLQRLVGQFRPNCPDCRVL